MQELPREKRYHGHHQPSSQDSQRGASTTGCSVGAGHRGGGQVLVACVRLAKRGIALWLLGHKQLSDVLHVIVVCA